MATLATQTITRAGLEVAYANAAAGDKFVPTNRTFLHVVNGSGGDVEVTVATPGEAIEDVAIADLVVDVTAGEERMIGPFPGGTFANQADSGLAAITYESTTTVTIAVLELP